MQQRAALDAAEGYDRGSDLPHPGSPIGSVSCVRENDFFPQTFLLPRAWKNQSSSVEYHFPFSF